MKTIMSVMVSVLAASTLYAAPVVTPCTGSWDGPGLTACELLGREADVIGGGFNANVYLPGFTLLYEITDFDTSNELTILGNGQLKYKRNIGHLTYTSNSTAHENQFAYWFFKTHTIVGIEDLGGKPKENSDWDYNDYVVRFDTVPSNVPEPTMLLLFGVGLGMVARRLTRKDP